MSSNSYVINTYSYTLARSAGDCLTHLAEQGYAKFELMMYPGHAWPAELDAAGREALGRLCRERGLGFTTLNMPNVDLNLGGAAPEMRRHTLAILKGVVELAGSLGVPGVVIGPGKYNPLFPAPKENLMGWFFEALDELAPLAAREGTAILVENMPFAFLPGAGEVMEALERYGSEEIGVVYDVANAAFIGEEIGEGLRRVLPRLRLVHVSDTTRARYAHGPVGSGDMDFRAVAESLAGVQYRGPIVLEIISTTPDEDFRDSIAKLSEQGWDALGK